MGWWDAGILGGDEPWDALGTLEKAVKWKVDEEYKNTVLNAVGSRKRQLRRRLKVHLSLPNSVKATEKLIGEWHESKNNEAVSILAVVYALIDLRVPFSETVECIALQAVKQDEWGQAGDRERVEALDDFKARLAALKHGTPMEKKFKVSVERVERMRGEKIVNAVSVADAKDQIRELARKKWGKDCTYSITDVVEIP